MSEVPLLFWGLLLESSSLAPPKPPPGRVGSGFGVWGLGFGVWGSGVGVDGFGNWGLRGGVWGLCR